MFCWKTQGHLACLCYIRVHLLCDLFIFYITFRRVFCIEICVIFIAVIHVVSIIIFSIYHDQLSLSFLAFVQWDFWSCPFQTSLSCLFLQWEPHNEQSSKLLSNLCSRERIAFSEIHRKDFPLSPQWYTFISEVNMFIKGKVYSTVNSFWNSHLGSQELPCVPDFILGEGW